jgi:hypothetical protein
MTVNPPGNGRLLAVTDGRECLGHLINRGKLGIEAFTADEEFCNVEEAKAARAAALQSRSNTTPKT